MPAGDGTASAERDGRSIRLPNAPTSGARARSFVVETLRAWQVAATACDDAELVVSELVTNAFLHGHATEVGVTVADRDAVVRVEVDHREPLATATPLAPLTVGAEQTHGRGLAIIDVLSSAWGVDEDDGVRRVWAELVAGRSGVLPVADRDPALNELALALRVPTTAGGVGDEVARWARVRLAVSFAGLAVPDDDPTSLRYLSVDPLPQAGGADRRRVPLAADAPVAAAYRDARPHFHESRNAAVAAFPGLGPALEASQVVAHAHLPLLVGDRPLGTLVFAWSHGRVLDTSDRSWLAAVAEVTAVALARVGVRAREVPAEADGVTS